MRTWLWLLRHGRHGTGPMIKKVRARATDRAGDSTGDLLLVVYYRCECRAIRPISRDPIRPQPTVQP